MSWLKYILLAVFLLGGTGLHAQNADSLKRELAHAQTPKQKLLLTFLTANEYSLSLNDAEIDTSIVYLKRTIGMATEQHNDSLVMESEDLLGIVYSIFNDLKSAQAHYEKAIKIAAAANNDARQVRFLFHFAAMLNDHGKPEQSMDLCNTALAKALQLHDVVSEDQIKGVMADIYIISGRYDIALELLNRCIKINDSLKNYGKLANSYQRITRLYGQQKKYKEALVYALKMDSIFTQTNDIEQQHKHLVDLAIIYKNLGAYDKAISLYDNALKYFTTDHYFQMFIYANRGIAYSMKGAYSDAINDYRLSEQLNKGSFHIEGISFNNNKEMANTLFKMGQLDSALYYSKVAEHIASVNPSKFDEYNECIKLISDIYAAKGDVKNAIVYSRRYEALQDNAFAARQGKSMAEQETRFHLNEKDKEVQMLAKENSMRRVKEQWQIIGLILIGFIVVIVIIAYRRSIQKNRIIDMQVVQLEAAATVKDRFIGNISHELRTPLTLLTGMLELTKADVEQGKPAELVKIAMAYNNSCKLQHMVEEILALSRNENREQASMVKVVQIAPLLKRIVQVFEVLTMKNGLSLEYDDTTGGDAYAALDTNKFEKIINNVVYNAVKFNKPSGFVKVAMKLPADKSQVVIMVSDSGAGIAANELPHIFERFYQGTVSSKAKSEGVGIGLSLVKEFTELFGGTITVQSEVGQGTTFTLTLPAAPKEMANVEELPDEMPNTQWENFDHKNTVLLVEDNTEMRYYLREVLGDKVNIAEAGNGKDALAWLATNTPDLIISDMMMPEMDGREFVTNIKNSAAWNKIPVITLTALSDMDNHLSMLRLGVDDYIVKPFNADELRIRVYNLLQNFAARKQFNQELTESDDLVVTDQGATEFKNKIKEYVLANLKYEDISIDDMAREMAISRRQLFRLAKSITGYTPGQLIKEVRLQKAYELLLSEKIYKLDDISKRVGFENSSYFSRQFLERFGKRPADFL